MFNQDVPGTPSSSSSMSSVDCLLSPEAERQPTCGKDYQTSLSKTILYVTLRLLKVVCLDYLIRQ